jgi:protein required for attachment to host cells
MLNPKDRYWVLVADSGRARLLEMRRKPYTFQQLSEVVSDTRHLTSKELASDASGRVYHAQGPGTHGMQPRSDPHELAEEQFAGGLAKKVSQAASKGRFEHLVLVADARTLGRLRRDMGKAASDRVLGERALNLSNLPLQELEPRIRNILGWAA